MKKFVVLISVIALINVAGVSVADTPPPGTSNPDYAEPQATVLSKEVVRPKSAVYRKAKLTIPTQPTVQQVHNIINDEAVTWGVSPAALSNRVYCESRYHWWATNGQYVGVLQMGANAFYRGLSSLRTRKVVVITTGVRRMHSRVYRHWSDNKVTRSRGRIVRQRVLTTRIGWLPKRPAQSDAWTQIRIGAQALRGISAVRSSEWSCAA